MAQPSNANEFTNLTGGDNNNNNRTDRNSSFFGFVQDIGRRFSSKVYGYENASAPPIELSERGDSERDDNYNYASYQSQVNMPPGINSTGYEQDHDDEFDDDDIDTFDRWRLLLGLFFIAIAVIDWVAMSEVLQLIETSYDKPYFLRYCVNSGYTLLIFAWFVVKKCNDKYYANNDNNSINNFNKNSGNVSRETTDFNRKQKPLWRRILLPAFVVNFVGVFAGYFWYLSLDYTTASISNTISQAQVAFVYPLSAIVIGTSITFQKDLGVLLSLSGVVLVAVGTSSDTDGDSGTNTVGGLIESVIATLFYSIYEVMINYYGEKHFSPLHIVQDTLLLNFFMGLWNILTMWPIILLLDWWEIETFELPTDLGDWATVLIPVGMDLIFTAAFCSAIVLTNSFFVAMGSLLVVPLTYAADLLWHGYAVTSYAIAGSVCIVCGFLLIEIPVVKYIRRKLGISKSSICFSEYNRRRRLEKMKRKSAKDSSYHNYTGSGDHW